jgi:hypothetical protein
MDRSLKRKLLIVVAVLAMAAFAGVAYAATQSSGPASRQAFLNDVAKRLHVTPQQLTAALNGAFTDQLQAAVKAGKLTQDQANALEQRLKRKGALPALPFGFSEHGLLLAPWRLGGLGLLGGPDELNAAASYLGLTAAQLSQQLAGGKSLAQIAATQHKSVNGLEQAMTTPLKAGLDRLVASKTITAAQEQKILSRLSARLSRVINRQGQPFPRVPRLPGGVRVPSGPRLPHGVPVLPAPPATLPAAPNVVTPTL